MNNRPQGQPLAANPDPQQLDHEMGNGAQEHERRDLGISPRAPQDTEFTRGDRINSYAPPLIGVAFNPRYAADGSSGEFNSESNGLFANSNPSVPRSGSSGNVGSYQLGLPFAQNESMSRSRVWSEFGLYSAELTKTTPSSVEALSLNRYSLGDPSFGTNYERRSTVCPGQLPSLFTSSSLRPSFGDNNSENFSSISDASSSAAQSSQAPTDFYSRENSGSSQSDTSQQYTDSSELMKKQIGSQLNQTVEISGRAGVPFGGPEGMASSGSGSLGGPPGGLPALTAYAREQRIQDTRFSPTTHSSELQSQNQQPSIVPPAQSS